MVQWSDSFWGEGNRSFEVLSSNVKNGAIAIEEFQRFLNESAQCESTYCKNLSRLQTQFIKIQHVGTFTPIWNLIRDLLDKISSIHLTTVNFYQDLLRDIHNYQELYQKKVKLHIQKDVDITRTSDLITQLNNSLNTVNKAKEQYYSIAFDYERTKRVGNNLTNSLSTNTSQDNNSTSLAQAALNSLSLRQTERTEKKYRQAQDDYKLTIEKYNSIRNDYEKRFSDVCTKFQDFEIDHIEKMLVFALNYSEILQRNNEQIRITQNEFNEKLKLLTGNDLLDTFIEQKKTGTDRPAPLQFEEIDNRTTSISLTNSNITDLPSSQDDLFDQLESGVPSFQAHFSIPSSNTKTNDNNHRALSPSTANNHLHSSSNNATMTPSSNNGVTPLSANNSLTRSQESNNNSNQTSNPFDVKIRRSKFPVGFFGSHRKEKNGKKIENKSSITTKSSKISQVHRRRDEKNGVNLRNSNNEANDFNTMADNNDDFVHITSNINKLTRESYGSSSSNSNNDTNRHSNQSTNPFPSSRISKTTSTSDTSDDDDNPMLKIEFKINPKSQALSEGNDETKIINAMRLVDKNIGNFALNFKESPQNISDMNKSVSSGQIGTRIPLPPPSIPSRPATTIPNSITVDNIDQSNIFPSHDEFIQSSFNSLNITSTNQENLSLFSELTTENKNTTSISPTDDDKEVANSFPNDDWTNKTTPFPILQVPFPNQLNQQQSISTSISPSMNPNLNNSPIISNEQTISPLTIGAMDQIPLAIAFQETIHVMMSGNNQENWKSRITGEMLISFPASMLNLLIDSSRFSNTLEFQLKNLDNIENIITKSSLITQNELIYSFDMIELNNILHNLQEKTPSSRFFNLNILNYEIKHSDVSNIPIHISSQWTRTLDTISININYYFNSSALPESIRINNDIVMFYTIITEGRQIKESSPIAGWSANEHKLWWKVPYINNGTGNLSAIMKTDTVENDNDQQESKPLTTSSIVNVQFIGENALFSSIDFELTCRGYRISLLKKKILSGKYQFEPDQNESLHLFQHPTISPSSAV